MEALNELVVFKPLFIIKLRHHPIVFGRSWIKKHKVLLDMTKKFYYIISPGYCIVCTPDLPSSPIFNYINS